MGTSEQKPLVRALLARRRRVPRLEGEGHYAFLDPRQPAFETGFGVLDRWRRQT
jgi:hypothetical protein